MKENISAVRHGEVILKHVDSLPEGATLLESSKKYMVAHSETGHHHILESKKDFKIFTYMGDRYIEIPSVAELWHQKSGADVHKTHKITPAIYKINIKKQYDYFAKKMMAVRD